jgi:hypothetical protein
MELRHALAQVSEIREHLTRTELFRGYRSLTVAFSGVVGLAAAAFQAIWLQQPTEQLTAYLALWVSAAVLNLAIVGIEMLFLNRWMRTGLARQRTLFAAEQFVPALVVGGFVTIVIIKRATEVAWMLPGLWALLFSLGIFASCRLLPRPIFIAGTWYVVGGVLALMWGRGEAALSPWSMGIVFGGGQLLTATILYLTLERPAVRLDGDHGRTR